MEYNLLKLSKLNGGTKIKQTLKIMKITKYNVQLFSGGTVNTYMLRLHQVLHIALEQHCRYNYSVFHLNMNLIKIPHSRS